MKVKVLSSLNGNSHGVLYNITPTSTCHDLGSCCHDIGPCCSKVQVCKWKQFFEKGKRHLLLFQIQKECLSGAIELTSYRKKARSFLVIGERQPLLYIRPIKHENNITANHCLLPHSQWYGYKGDVYFLLLELLSQYWLSLVILYDGVGIKDLHALYFMS